MSTKEIQEKLVADLKRWQKIEDEAVSSTAFVMEKIDNPMIRLVMEIVLRDSQMHRRVQQLIVDSLEKEVTTLTPEEMAEVWGLIDRHVLVEQRTIEIAEALTAQLKEGQMVVQQYLLKYLLEDEKKHISLLEGLSKIKERMYAYG